MAGLADGLDLNGMQKAGLALSNFADAMAMFTNRPSGYAANNLNALQQLQRQLLMTQQFKQAQAQQQGAQDLASATAPQTVSGLGGAVPGAPADPNAAPLQYASQVSVPGNVGNKVVGDTGEFQQAQMDILKKAFAPQLAEATVNKLTAPPQVKEMGRGGLGVFDANGNLIRTIAAQPGASGADTKLVNLVDSQNPKAGPRAYSETSAAALMNSQPGRYVLAGDMKGSENVTARDLSAAEIQALGLPPGTLAQRKSNGELEIKNKPTGQDYFQAMPQGLTGEDAYSWVEKNLPGGNEIAAMARQVEAGKKLPPPMGRQGSVGEKVNGLLALAVPGYDLADIKNRYQLNQELTNQSDKALGGKLNSVSKIVNHSVGLLDSAIDLDNYNNTAVNWLRNEAPLVGKAANSNEALAAFKKNQEGLGNEFEKLSGGGIAGQQARAEAAGSYSSNAGMPATIGSVGKTIEMMEGQFDPLVANYNRVFGKNLDTDAFIRTVMNQPKIADKLQGMKEIVAGYKQTGQVPTQALAAVTGRKAAGAPSTGGSAAAAIPTSTPKAIIQNGWRYDPVTHMPLGPAQ